MQNTHSFGQKLSQHCLYKLLSYFTCLALSVIWQGGCNFYIENKLKSEIFNDKKVDKQKCFFSVKTKNSNWDILTKNLVAFKRLDWVKNKKC